MCSISSVPTDIDATLSVMSKSKVQIIIVDDRDAVSDLCLLQTPDVYEQDLCTVARVVVYWTEQAEEKYPFIITNSVIRRWEGTEESTVDAVLSNIKKYIQHPGKTLRFDLKV